jgi:two-component system sensor histidine kinase/response regulator
MKDKIKILIVEDVTDDAELAAREIKKSIPTCSYKVVDNQKDYLDALIHYSPDIILSDYTLPCFDGLTALKLAQKQAPLIPFIIFTGSQNEDIAVECMKAGASDYVIKEQIKRLGPAVVHTLEQKETELETERIKTLALEKQKMYEQMLIDNEARAKAFLTNNPDVMFLFSIDGVILDCKAENKSLLITPPEKIIGKNITELVSDRLAKLALEAIRAVSSTGEAYSYEYELKVGSAEHFESRFVKCGEDTFLNIVRDITPRKQAENRLIQSEAKYKALLEANPDLMFLFSEDGTFLEYKATKKESLLFPPEHFIGKNIMEVLPPEITELTMEKIKLARQTGEIQTYEYELIFGEATYFECRLVPCGKSEYLAIVRDITDKKTIEERLSFSEEKYRRIFETSNEGILCIDAECRITLLNQKTADMLGYTIDEIVGKPFEFLLFEEDIAEHEQRIAERSSGKKDSYERRFLRKDGTTLWTIISATPELDRNGAFKGSFGMLTDITERKNYEAQLKESETRYRRLFETANEGIWGVNSNGLTIYVNQKMAEMLGYSVAEMAQKLVIDYIFAEDMHDYEIKTKERRAGKAGYYERRLKKRDGSVLWVIVSATPVIEEDGISIGSFAMYTEITERKLLEQALQDTLVRYRIQRNNMLRITMSPNISEGKVDALAKEICEITASSLLIDRVGVWLFDEKRTKLTCLVMFDRNTHEFSSGMVLAKSEFNSEFQHLETSNFLDCDDPLTDPRVKSLAQSYLKPNKISALLDVVIKNQGINLGVVCLELVGKHHHWELDEISYASQLADQMSLAIAHKNRILAENELRDSEHRYRQILEMAPIGIAIHTDGKVVYANPYSAKVMAAREANEIIGMDIKDIIHPDDQASTIDRIKRLVAGEKGLYPAEELFVRKDGVPISVEVNSSVIEYKNKQSFQVIVSDITARKHMTEELIKAKEEAEQMSKIKSTFLANMSHELRTPLVGILGYSELLTNMLHEEDTKDMANTINVSGRRLLHTLNLILDLSRVEANQQDIHWEIIELNHFIRDKVKLFEIVAMNKGLELSFNSQSKDICLNTDSRLLDHVVNDLINNAIKYTDKGKVSVHLTIEQTISGNEILIKVVDTGIGIPQHQQGIIFDAFRQVSEGLDRSFEGTGLGLTISKRYVELLGGRITLESKVGSGSAFTVIFPETKIAGKTDAHKSASNTETTSASKQAVHKVKLPKVLLIDDDEISYVLIRKMLSGLVELDYAPTGQKALDAIKTTVYAMVFLDINLPKGVSGLDVLIYLRQMKEYLNTPVVAITAYSMLGDKENFLAKGCSHYLSKPFSKDELIKLLDLIK